MTRHHPQLTCHCCHKQVQLTDSHQCIDDMEHAKWHRQRCMFDVVLLKSEVTFLVLFMCCICKFIKYEFSSTSVCIGVDFISIANVYWPK